MDQRMENIQELNEAELNQASDGRTKVRPSGLTVEEKKRILELLGEDELAAWKAMPRASEREQFFIDHKFLIGK